MPPKSNIRPQNFLKQKKISNGQEQQRWPKRVPQSQAQEDPKKQMQDAKLNFPHVQQHVPIPQSYKGMLPSRPSFATRRNIFGDILT